MKKETIIILGILILLTGIIFISAVEIVDNDGDGYNSTVDCNDSNVDAWQNINLYADNDSDAYGAGNAALKCIGSSTPSGFSNNSGDCNDSNSLVFNNIIGYIDRDNDNFGDNSVVNFCLLSLPINYVNINGDCEDTNPYTFPNATEKCNGVDDDCDGLIDENYPDKGQACYVGVNECRNQGITICNIDQNGTFCKGIPKKPTWEICDGKDNDCDGLIDEDGICDIFNTTFKVFSPNNLIYNVNKININLSLISSSGIKADKISYTDNSAGKIKEILLCKKCRDYGFFIKKSINLNDGAHNLTFKALLNDSALTEDISIFIDTKKPTIRLPNIRTKLYTNGTFYFNYDEINLKEINLSFENKSWMFYNCSSGKKQECKINMNLSEYEGKDIVYNYALKDIAGNSQATKNITAEIDITPPKIENITYPVIGNYVYFKLNITEKNFKDISYYDNSGNNLKWRVLCSVLKDGICEKEQRLSPGEHNITIRVLDKAGNSASVFV